MIILVAAMFGIGITMIVLASWGLSQSSFEGIERASGEKRESAPRWSLLREVEEEWSENFVPYTDFWDIPTVLIPRKSMLVNRPIPDLNTPLVTRTVLVSQAR